MTLEWVGSLRWILCLKDSPCNSPYAFSENRVIDAIELDGLERISVNNYGFASFDDSNEVYHGDVENTGFEDKVNPGSKDLNEEFRLGSRVTLSLTGKADVIKEIWGSYSHWTGDTEYSAVKFYKEPNYNEGNLDYHFPLETRSFCDH